MIKIHREGYTILFVTLVILFAVNVLVHWLTDEIWIRNVSIIASLIVYGLVLQFFRNPDRKILRDENKIIAPADGKIVIIEEVEEQEFFKDKRLQISIFMSPLNVHINRYPVSGKIEYAKHHQGKYLVAWHPKSSTLNERTTVVIQNPVWGPILYRQIAGYVARRIVMYAREGLIVRQGDESGFIKFGSRLDIFLPPGTVPSVKIGDRTVGGITVIAEKR
ncbi:phosphatidylserine decarboxylase family protein [Schleiferia thermophila]|jgi:phosphatidylserine decarboxylase|uniref:Phosphatidylserine decarboxylase proenzyme n=1 Tax=Schleiferia thermophila TaxID=884107 RepID=A0A369A216_9FLAO|nr:phosphatidylserine decarboxylase family protein [Schleiferia thermophila]RCX03352.1 phosphatidylserine decarboxylase [Schleiferia thermophila]GCD80481.1 phosphatidylserine decarboxylase [Schleiferia thermophila]